MKPTPTHPTHTYTHTHTHTHTHTGTHANAHAACAHAHTHTIKRKMIEGLSLMSCACQRCSAKKTDRRATVEQLTTNINQSRATHFVPSATLIRDTISHSHCAPTPEMKQANTTGLRVFFGGGFGGTRTPECFQIGRQGATLYMFILHATHANHSNVESKKLRARRRRQGLCRVLKGCRA